MARPRTFDVSAAVATAGGVFARLGYAATSVDDLVGALGLHRGSLYQAFGSKRGLFLAALRRAVEEVPRVGERTLLDGPALDLVLVAALELAPEDEEVRDLVRAATTDLTRRDGPPPAELLGERLLRRARLTAGSSDPHPPGPTPPDPA